MIDYFASLIGHENVKEFLTDSYNKNKISHAYIFCGPENVGKTKAAECFAALLLNQLPHSPSISQSEMGQPPYSPPVSQGEIGGVRGGDDFQFLKNNPDFFLIERGINEKTKKPSQDVTIGQIRALGGRIESSSFLGGKKVVVVKEADLMNREAANSFLKNLEEPRGDTVIILLVNKIEALPATVMSRCQIIYFHPVSPQKIKEHLLALGADSSKADFIIKMADSRPGLALRLFSDKNLFNFYKEETENFLEMLNLSLAERLAVARKSLPGKEVDKLREKMYNTLSVWMVTCRDLMRQSTQELGATRSRADFANLLEKLNKALGQIKANVNPKLILENIMINIKN